MGCWRDRRRLIVLLVLVFVPLAFVFRVYYEDRYLFPSAAMAVLLAFHGAQMCARRFRRATPKRLFQVFLLLEAIPALVNYAMSVTGGDAKRDFNELREIGLWVRRNTPQDAMLLTVPFWSPHYLAHRKTALFPIGELDVVRAVAERYNADYMLFEWFWPGDQPPRLPFLIPLLRGQRHVLFRIDRAHPAYWDPDRWIPHMSDFDWIGYFWKDRLSIQVDPPLFKALAVLCRSTTLGAVVAGAIWTILVLMPPVQVRRRAWLLLLAPIPLGVFLVQIMALMHEVEPLRAEPPPFGLIQARRYI